MSSVIKLARDLLNIPSPSGDEKELGLFLVRRLRKNFKVKTQTVGNSFNVIATKGTPNIVLNIHFDTVPGSLKVREDKNWLYGRGACDAKGPLAAMVVAGEIAVEQGVNNFGLVFNVNEETDFSGVREVIKEIRPKRVIVGEPTDFNAVIGQKGLIGFKIKSNGISAHGATPEKGKSAILDLIKKLDRVSKLKFPVNPPLGNCTVNIGKISGGSAVNVVPESAEAIVEIRTSVKNKVVLDCVQESIGNIDLLYSFDPVITRDNSWIKQVSKKTEAVPYFTEMYFWSKAGADAVVFGPGSSKYAHSKRERIRKGDLVEGVKKYLMLLRENQKRQRLNNVMNTGGKHGS